MGTFLFLLLNWSAVVARAITLNHILLKGENTCIKKKKKKRAAFIKPVVIFNWLNKRLCWKKPTITLIKYQWTLKCTNKIIQRLGSQFQEINALHDYKKIGWWNHLEKGKKIIETPVMLFVFSLLILRNAFKPTNKNRADESNFEILYGWGPVQ